MRTSLRLRLALALGLACGLWLTATTARARLAPSPPSTRVAVVPLHGPIDHRNAVLLARGLERARAQHADTIVLDLDTGGGGLRAAYDIVGAIEALPDEVRTVAFVRGKAISAGAMIALACDAIAMAPGSRLGDCAPMVSGPGGEKIRSPLRAEFRKFAHRHGVPEALLEAMIDPRHDGIERLRLAPAQPGATDRATETRFVSRTALQRWTPAQRARILERKLVLAPNQLLTVHRAEALAYGLCRYAVDDLDALLAQLERESGRAIERLDLGPTLTERLALAISGPLHGWLLFLGVLGLVVELLHPGLVLPGVLGAACLGLALFSSHVLGLLDTLDVALLVLGAALLLLEVFVIPGFGAAGVAGLVAFALGVLLSLQPFVLPDPNDPAQKALLLRHLRGLAFGGIGLLAALALLVRVLPRSPWLHRLVLTGAQRPEDGYTVAAPDRVALIGRRGRARTALRPAGKVEIAGEPVDAVTEGDWIEAGAEIEVIGTDANRVLVRSTHRMGGENVA